VYLLGKRPEVVSWEARWVRWPDFRLPTDRVDADDALREVWRRAAAERVEIACGGGRGRTGTALACFVNAWRAHAAVESPSHLQGYMGRRRARMAKPRRGPPGRLRGPCAEHYDKLRKPLDPKAFTARLREEMRTELTALNDALPDLDWLRITSRKSGAIQLTAPAARVSWWLSRITAPSPAPRE
jgi:hypothetical protein